MLFGDENDSESYKKAEADDEDFEIQPATKLDKKRVRTTRPLYELDFEKSDNADGDDEFHEEMKKVVKAKAVKKKAKKEQVPLNANMVKTNNKLIGQVENGDLYADDEGLMDNRS